MWQLLLIALVASAVSAAPQHRNNIRLDGRIVGGTDIDISDAPYQISLQESGSHICGGSVISDEFVVTAAHCTDGARASSLSIRAGSSTRGRGGQVVNVKTIHQHPHYDDNLIDYDISILRLANKLTLGGNVKQITLASENENIPAGTNALVTGWGTLSEDATSLPSQLQGVTIQVLGNAVCKQSYGSASITNRMICAGTTAGGKDSCQGDSGGPLVTNGKLIGVVSWGYGCARKGYPGLYASVPALRSYVHDVTGI